MANFFGADLGSYNLKIFSKHHNSILKEHDTIAVIHGNQLYNYGNEAYELYEKAPANIEVSFPISGGVISDFNHLQFILMEILNASNKRHVRGSSVVIALPTNITEVEKKAFYDLFYQSKMKPKEVLLCEKPIAAAVGLGLDPQKNKSRMVVDTGADTTEIAIMNHGGIVAGERVVYGGNHMDEAISTYIRREYNLMIGMKSAQYLKEHLGSAYPDMEGSEVIIGRDMVSGLPIEAEVDAAIVYDAIHTGLENLTYRIKRVLENADPEVSGDIYRSGIYLTGGSSRLKGLDTLISKTTGLPVKTGETPEESVARGLKEIALNPIYEDLAYPMVRRLIR